MKIIDVHITVRYIINIYIYVHIVNSSCVSTYIWVKIICWIYRLIYSLLNYILLKFIVSCSDLHKEKPPHNINLIPTADKYIYSEIIQQKKIPITSCKF